MTSERTPNDNRAQTSPAQKAAQEPEKPAEKPKAEEHAEENESNPPRTTSKKWFTAPKFGSAGSGGAEIEPGVKKD